MDFRELNYVLAIAKHQSITKAAKSLYLSQPTLSRFLKALENNIDRPLFFRFANRYKLTPAGEVYVKRAQQMLDMRKLLEIELKEIAEEMVGTLKVAFPMARGSYILPLVLPEFRRRFPHIKVEIVEANSLVLEDHLLQGNVDLAFMNLPIVSQDIEYEIIAREEICLIMSSQHHLASSAIFRDECKYQWIDIKVFGNELFILLDPSQRTARVANEIFRTNDITPMCMHTFNLTTMVHLVAVGYGVGFIKDTHLENMPLSYRPIQFSVGNPFTETIAVVAYRKNTYLSKYYRAFIEIVKQSTR